MVVGIYLQDNGLDGWVALHKDAWLLCRLIPDGEKKRRLTLDSFWHLEIESPVSLATILDACESFNYSRGPVMLDEAGCEAVFGVRKARRADAEYSTRRGLIGSNRTTRQIR
jgi:hypothetical protein